MDECKPLMIGVKKVMGGGMRDSFLVDGVAFKKTFSYAGFEQQPKYFDNPKAGLTLVHFSAQLEPCLTQENTLHTLHTF